MVSWLSQFNPIPHFSNYTGPYSVGTVDIEIASNALHPDIVQSDRIPSTVAFRCFYPSEATGVSTRPVHWVQSPQRKTINAYARFLGAGSTLSTTLSYFSHLLYYITIPAKRNAPIHASPHPSRRWPVVVFSHGLGGSRNAYSHLCGSLASHGLMVIAADHRDGSQPISYVRATEQVEAHTIDYLRLPHQPSPEVYNGRDEQLRIRIAELSLIHEALLQMDKGGMVKNLDANKDRKGKDTDVLSMFRDMLDVHTPGTIAWAGHSMGAATTVQFVKSVFYAQDIANSPILTKTPSNTLKAQITSDTPTILLDLWAMPLKSPATSSLKSRSMPCFSPSGHGGAPLLAILSEAFFKWRGNYDDVQRALSDSRAGSMRRPQANIFYPVASAHLSQSDFGILFPSVTKYLAKADEPERTLRLNVRAILEVLRRGGIAVAETSAVDMEEEEQQVGTEMEKPAEKSNTSAGGGDWRILSRKQGVVRGWVALGHDDDSRAVKMAEKAMDSTGTGQRDSTAGTIGDDELRGAREDSAKV